MKSIHFAIVGAGTAGIASAILLAKQNIQVTLFEKVTELEPVGAGLLLQPAGLAVFAFRVVHMIAAINWVISRHSSNMECAIPFLVRISATLLQNYSIKFQELDQSQ